MGTRATGREGESKPAVTLLRTLQLQSLNLSVRACGQFDAVWQTVAFTWETTSSGIGARALNGIYEGWI